MRAVPLVAAFLVAATISPQPGRAAERRCGWVENPTPGNWWLRDREAEWTIATMADYEAAGINLMPDMTTAGWVETNGHYGYGCGCMTVEVDRAAKRITRLLSANPVPLTRCGADRSLPKP